MKFCVDCRWFAPVMHQAKVDADISRCRYMDRRNMITGEPDYLYANVMRTSTAADRCGPDASFFMPAETGEVCDGE
jgi:hypothetical protein